MLVKSINLDAYMVGIIDKGIDAKSDKLFAQGNVVCPIYNDGIELEGDIFMKNKYILFKMNQRNKLRVNVNMMTKSMELTEIKNMESGNLNSKRL